jgi:hypothetical protein
MPQFSHLQVLSSQWSLVLYGCDGTPPGAKALVWRRCARWQNLSNGYFLLSSRPVLAYALFEIATRKPDGRGRVGFASVTIIVTALTLPFLLPYLGVARLGFGPVRSPGEILSADVFSYWTAPGELACGAVGSRYPAEDLFDDQRALLGCLGVARSLYRVGARRTDPRHSRAS